VSVSVPVSVPVRGSGTQRLKNPAIRKMLHPPGFLSSRVLKSPSSRVLDFYTAGTGTGTGTGTFLNFSANGAILGIFPSPNWPPAHFK
jgi:hypothetical protein